MLIFRLLLCLLLMGGVAEVEFSGVLEQGQSYFIEVESAQDLQDKVLAGLLRVHRHAAIHVEWEGLEQVKGVARVRFLVVDRQVYGFQGNPTPRHSYRCRVEEAREASPDRVVPGISR